MGKTSFAEVRDQKSEVRNYILLLILIVLVLLFILLILIVLATFFG